VVSFRNKLAFATLAGLVGAGIVHIATLLLIPAVSDIDTWGRLATLGNLNEFHGINHGGSTAESIRALDPTFEVAACRFDLRNGPVQILSDGSAPLWSMSIYNRRGENIFSINDRTANQAALDVIIATPLQVIELKKTLTPDLETSIVAENDIEEGFTVLRAFVEDKSFKPQVNAFLEGASCDLY
jgi:uncharacterized membrane protein